DAIYYGVNSLGDAGIQKYEVDLTGQLSAGGYIAGATTFRVVSETKGYYYNADLNDRALQIFNPSTMSRTGEIDLSSMIDPLAADTAVKNVAIENFMVSGGGMFYAKVSFSGNGGLPVYDSTHVIVIDEATDQIVDWAIYPEHFIFGYFDIKSGNFVKLAEDGYIYLSAFMSDFAEGPNAVTVRIKAGETNFDPNFKIDYNGIVEGSNAFILGGGTYLNGKLYVKIKPVAPDWSNSGDVNFLPYEVDVASGQISLIEGIPVGTWGSVQGPFLYNGKVYIISSEPDVGEHYYTFDPETREVEKVLTVTSGVPTDLFILE
ncbi:MAG: hypothetical protein AAF804_20235, partial [Bacteroidota bacterium]